MLHRLLPRKPRVSSETWSANRRTVDALVKTSALGDMPKFVFEALDTGGEEAAHEVSDLFQQLDARDPEKSKVLGASVNSLLLQKRAETKAKTPNTQTAFAPAIPFLLGGAAAALGTGEVLRRMNKRREQKALPDKPPAGAPPPVMQPRPPKGPDPRDRNTKTTTPPQRIDPPRTLTGFSTPIPEFGKPQIWIAPDLTNKIAETIMLERRENDDTKAQIDIIRDTVLNGNSDLEHIGGDRNQETGEDMPETRIPGPGVAFDHPVTGKPGDSRPGSRYADLTFKNLKTKKIFHVQTVDVDKNGKTTARELEAAESIRRATRQNIILIQKKWQLEKLRKRKPRRSPN